MAYIFLARIAGMSHMKNDDMRRLSCGALGIFNELSRLRARYAMWLSHLLVVMPAHPITS